MDARRPDDESAARRGQPPPYEFPWWTAIALVGLASIFAAGIVEDSMGLFTTIAILIFVAWAALVFVNQKILRSLSATSIENWRTLDGLGYEHECATVLRSHGWKAEVTNASNDQGVDIIAKRGTHVVAIQCKRYAKPASNSAVQQVYTGKKFYGANAAVVVASAGFTASARNAAARTGVLLIGHEDLAQLHSRVERGALS